MSSQPEQSAYDVIVLGAGPAGENVVDRVVRGGLSCAVVEAELVGGECSYWACVPSKALLRPLELRSAAARLRGLSPGPLGVAEVLARRDAFTGRSGHGGPDDGGQVAWLDGLPATLVRGHGRLTGDRRVGVQGPDGDRRQLEARHAVVLATGTTAAVPPLPGLSDVSPWTSREATAVAQVPARVVVLGGGVVACEMAHALRGLGAEEVTMLQRGKHLLGRMEPFAGELLRESLQARGLQVRTGTTVTGVGRVEGGEVRVTLADGDVVAADEVLVALGRSPRTSDVGLDAVGLRPGGYVAVDDTLRADGVSGGWLYAVGDVNGRNLLTHMGKYQARICGEAIVARAAGREPTLRASADAQGAPQVVFTDPQVAAVGRTEAAARADGLSVRAVEYDIGQVTGAALLADGYRGRAKLVVDERDRIVLGATFVGSDVAELVHSATVAVVGRVPLDVLWHAVPSFPTVSEVWLRLLETYGL